MKNSKLHKQKAFSLVELLVVVAIIGVLAATGVVGYDRYVETTKIKVLTSNFGQVVKAIEFEQVVAANGLQTSIKEQNADGDWIDEDGNTTSNKADARYVYSDTPCDNFIHSLKAHFEEGDEQKFKNPWNTSWDSIVLDTYWTGAHRKGQIQIVCYVHQNYGDGGGCPLKNARFYIQAMLKNGGRFAYNYNSDGTTNGNDPNGDCNGTIPSNMVDNNAKVRTDCWWKDTKGTFEVTNETNGKALCEWDEDIHGTWSIRRNTPGSIPMSAGGSFIPSLN